MQVGTTKDQGLYNNPSAAVHPGALAAGTLPQYNKIKQTRSCTVYLKIEREMQQSFSYISFKFTQVCICVHLRNLQNDLHFNTAPSVAEGNKTGNVCIK